MLTNFIKTTIRYLLKNRTLSIINTAGLTIGLTAVILTGIYIRHELSFDRFHKNAGQIYRIERKGMMDGGEHKLPHTNNLIPEVMAGTYSAIDEFVRIWPVRGMLRDHRQKYHQQEVYMADSSFFTMFSFPLEEGTAAEALHSPNTVVLTEKAARKYFGTRRVIGEPLQAQLLDSTVTLTITGIMEPIPESSHLQTDIVVSYQTAKSIAPARYLDTWMGNYLYSYVKVQPGTDIKQLESQFPDFLDKYMSADLRRIVGEDADINQVLKLYLQPLTDIYLHPDLNYSIGPSGDINKIYTAMAIALIVLIIAGMNYINLSTARSLSRSKEVGLRKVFGAGRSRIIIQFIAESVILSVIALVLSMIAVETALPFFNAFLGKELSIGYLADPQILVYLLLLAGGLGGLAGIYPALYTSSYPPATLMNQSDKASQGRGSAMVRKTLVILQFAITVALLISVFTMNNQLNYMIDKDMGFNQQRVMVIQSNDQQFRKNMTTISQELKKSVDVSNVALASSNLGEKEYGDGMFRVKGRPEKDNEDFIMIDIGAGFIPTLNITMAAGRNFSRDYRGNKAGAYIINEAALKKLGLENARKAIGTPLIQTLLKGTQEGIIVGVVKNFHYQPLQTPIRPLILTHQQNHLNHLFVRLSPGQTSRKISSVQSKFARMLPDFPFRYRFVDQLYQQGYRKELRMKKLFTVFSILAVVIASMGLFALAAFMTERKTKEIGIRKAVGASSSRIILMLSGQFLKWVLISNLMAWPLTYLLLKRWLQNFAYHVDLQPGYFVLASLLALFIAQWTVFQQAYKAAQTNPVQSLRYE